MLGYWLKEDLCPKKGRLSMRAGTQHRAPPFLPAQGSPLQHSPEQALRVLRKTSERPPKLRTGRRSEVSLQRRVPNVAKEGRRERHVRLHRNELRRSRQTLVC